MLELVLRYSLFAYTHYCIHYAYIRYFERLNVEIWAFFLYIRLHRIKIQFKKIVGFIMCTKGNKIPFKILKIRFEVYGHFSF